MIKRKMKQMNKQLTFLLSLTFLFFLSGCGEEVKKEFYDSGELKKDTLWKNGYKEGLETVWYESGEKWLEVQYKNGEERRLGNHLV